MSRRKMLVIPMLLSALAIFAVPGVPDTMGGTRLHAAEGDCWFKWLADATGTIYCKEEGLTATLPVRRISNAFQWSLLPSTSTEISQ